MILRLGVYHQQHKIQLLRDHQQRRSVTTEKINEIQKPAILDMNSSVPTILALFLAIGSLAKLVLATELG